MAIHRRSTIQAPTSSGRLLCQGHDRVAIPEDVPALGIRKGDEGVVRNLELYNDTVSAFVIITYSTGQTRGWVIMEIKPNYEVRSFTPSGAPASSEQQVQERFLGVQPVLCLVEDATLRPVYDPGRDLLASVRRQAV